MITKQLDTVIDLMGRRPIVRRPFVVGVLILLIASSVTVVALLWWHYSKTERQFARVFAPSLLLETRLVGAPRQIDLVRYSEQIEHSLESLSVVIAGDYGRGACSTDVYKGGFTIDAASQSSITAPPSCPLVSNDSTMRTFSHPEQRPRPGGQWIGDGYDSTAILEIAHYHLAGFYDTIPSLTINSGLARSSFRWALNNIAQSIVAAHNHLASGDSGEVNLHVNKDATIPRLYCALRLDRSLFDTARTNWARVTRSRMDALIDEKYTARRPRYDVKYHNLLEAERTRIDSSLIRYFDTIPFVMVGFPASPIPRDYDCTQREWFEQPMTSRKPHWTASYPDAGTGLPVITAAVPIFMPPDTLPIGVVAVDMFSRVLSQRSSEGYAYLGNFVVSLITAALLLGLIVATSRKRFDHLLWAFVSFELYYFFKICAWLTDERAADAALAFAYLDATLSFLSTVSLVIAALLTFVRFKHHPFIEDPVDQSSKVDRLVGWLQGKYKASFPLLSAITITAFTALLQLLLKPLGNAEFPVILRWMDACTSTLAVAIFGYFFSNWMTLYYRTWLVSVAYAAFAIFALVQLPYALPFIANEPTYWYLLIGSKGICFGLVLFCVFWWMQANNYERVRRGGSRSTIISRMGLPHNTILIAGYLETGQLLFVDRSTLIWSKRVEPKSEWVPSATNEYDIPERFDGWQASEFGSDLYVPSRGNVTVAELFEDGEFAKLRDDVLRSNPQVKVNAELSDRKTKRVTEAYVIENRELRLRVMDCRTTANDNRSYLLPLELVSFTAWEDVDRVHDGRSLGPPIYTGKFFVLHARVRRDKAVQNTTSPHRR